ncbi:MAG: hypothetical protein AAF830_03095 [Pseudomonadota bacterium]
MEFNFGRVIGRTFSTLGTNPVVFFGMSFLVAGLGGTFSAVINAQATGAFAEGIFSPLWIVGFIAAFIVPLIAGVLTNAALIFAAAESYKGRKASFGESLSKALPHLFPLIAISILYTLGLMLGFLLLIIPGIFLLVIWSVTIPVRVAEGTGVTESFGRSRELAKGLFWPIFGLLIVYFIGSSVVGDALAASGFMVSIQSLGAVAIIGTLIVNTFTGAVAASGSASLYYELRTVKEGTPTDEVVEIFA